MTNFWPLGFDLQDTASPEEILQLAKKEWSEQSNGLLSLVIQKAQSTTNNDMLIVHAKHVPSNRTATLFSVVHRPGVPYPARIQPRDGEIPDVLKKTYFRPGLAGYALRTHGEEVTNPWVCDTPEEFRSNLSEVFSLGSLKSEILSLISGATPSPKADIENQAHGESEGEGA